MHKHKIIIYCDGACSGNQFSKNIGGWGAVLKYGDRTKEIFGREINTSNQRMELTACIKAFEQIINTNYSIEVYSDSAYLVNCIQKRWYDKWLQNNWKNSHKKPVENQDLWIRLIDLLNMFNVTFHKVEAHTGNIYNERADSLAQKGIQQITKK